MKILVDNGHGLMTAGKRSPDGLFREAFYNREIARKVVADLLDRNLDTELLVPEDDDIPLVERVRRINAHCLALGKKRQVPLFLEHAKRLFDRSLAQALKSNDS